MPLILPVCLHRVNVPQEKTKSLLLSAASTCTSPALQNPFAGMNGVLDYWRGHTWAPHPLLPQAHLLTEAFVFPSAEFLACWKM